MGTRGKKTLDIEGLQKHEVPPEKNEEFNPLTNFNEEDSHGKTADAIQMKDPLN